MSEDEDVYFDNNQVHQYLKSFTEFDGCYDVLKVQRSDKDDTIDDPNCARNSPLNAISNQIHDKTLSHQIHQILKCGLMLEEDVCYIESVIDPEMLCAPDVHLHSTWSSHLDKLLVGGSACLLSALHLATSRHFSVPTGIVVISYTLWKCYKNHQQQKQIRLTEQLLHALHQLFKALKKSMQLVQENELLARGNILASSAGINFSSLPNLTFHGQLMLSLRSDIMNTVQKTVVAFSNGTKQLINTIPLVGQLNFNHNYLATLDADPLSLLNITEDHPLSSLKHNYNIYFLMQSEFLRRLSLCFCRNLWNSNKPRQLEKVGLIMSVLTIDISQRTTSLQREYNTCYTYGLKMEKKSIKNPLPTWKYSDVYIATHSAVLHLQAMLMKTCALQELLEKNYVENQNECSLDDLKNALEDVLKSTDSLESCCQGALTQLNKLNVTDPKSKIELVKSESDCIPLEHTTRSEDYVVEDEVFEAMSLECENLSGIYDNWESSVLTKEEKVKREIEQQVSHRLVKELKIALVSKSNEWKERERIALLKKSGLDSSDLKELSPLFDVPCNDGEWPLPRLKTALPKKSSSARASTRRLSLDSNLSHSLHISKTASCAADSSINILPSQTLQATSPLPPPPLPFPSLVSSPVPPPLPSSSQIYPSEGSTTTSTTLSHDQQEVVGSTRAPSQLERTISQGAKRFWSFRNQPIEDVFSGSGENFEDELEETVVEDDISLHPT